MEREPHQFTLRKLLFAVAVLAAYLTVARYFRVGITESRGQGVLAMAWYFVLLMSPVFALGWLMWKLEQSRISNLSVSTADEVPPPPDSP